MFSRIFGFFGRVLKQVTFTRAVRAAIVITVVPLVLYLYREVTRDALIINPFTVPKRFEESGLSGEVIANRIGDAMRQIETSANTRQKKDLLRAMRDEGSTPDVEIPGTKVGLRTVVQITQAIFERYPKHIGGDVVIAETPGSDPAKERLDVTVYVTRGRDRGLAIRLSVPARDSDSLVKSAAEMILERVNPYILAAYNYDQGESDNAIEIAQRIIQNPAWDHRYVAAAYNLWGIALDDQKKSKEAIVKYQRAVDLDPQNSLAYNNWGSELYHQGKYEEAIVKYQMAVGLDPKLAAPYNGWGLALDHQKKYKEAIVKYRKVVDLDPKSALAYNNWGSALDDQGKYEEAIVKYQKAVELDPKSALAYNNWGSVLHHQGKYEEAIVKYQRAVGLDPKLAAPYNNWGIALEVLGRQTEAQEQFAKARLMGNK